jgi:sulfonate transport system substrate-binding protein
MKIPLRTLTRAAALLVAGGLALTACAGSPAATAANGGDAGVLRLGPLGGQNPLSLAASDGILGDAVTAAGATMQTTAPFPAFAPAAEAMTADQIDMTSGSSTSLITALAGNPDIVVFAVEDNDNDTQGVVSAPNSGIRTIADLRGRTVAVNKGGTGDYILRMALESAGMTIADVTPVYLSPADSATAFSGGQVDAWATWDQYLVSAEALPGATQVALAKDIGATNRTIHVVSRAFLDAHPEVVQAAYDALVDQTRQVTADPSILVEAYEKAGAETAIAEAIGAKRTPTILPADAAYVTELTGVAQFYAEQGLTTSQIDVSKATVDLGSAA